MSQFFTLPTKIGQGLISNAIAYREPLTIATMAIGDGGGTLPSPDASVTRLVNEVRRGPINQTTTDPDNPNWIIAEQVLPPDVGGWTIREVGLYDTEGNLVAYGNYPETYKPQLSEGSSRTQTIRFVMEVTDTSAVTLKIDPSVVMASRQYVDDEIGVHRSEANSHNAGQIDLDEPLVLNKHAENVQAALSALRAGAYMTRTAAGLDQLGGSDNEVADTRQLVEMRSRVNRLVSRRGFVHFGGIPTRSAAGSYSRSLSFTTVSAGVVLAILAHNVGGSGDQPDRVQNNIRIDAPSGNIRIGDATLKPMTNTVSMAVAAGETVTVTGEIKWDASSGNWNNIGADLSFIFSPTKV